MKFTDLPKANEHGRKLELANAVIGSVSLSTADHGVLSGWLHLEFDCGGCGFGGFVLGKTNGDQRVKIDYAAEWIMRCIRVGGVEHWEKLPGRPLRVLHEGLGGGVVAIGHFMNDEWFCPSKEWEQP